MQSRQRGKSVFVDIVIEKMLPINVNEECEKSDKVNVKETNCASEIIEKEVM